MRTIVILGTGKSSSSLIQYLLKKSDEENLHLIIGDIALVSAQNKTNNHHNASAIAIDIFDEIQRKAVIQKADIVISMLPAHLHIEIARDCIIYKKHLVTASYISEAMQDLDVLAKENNLIFMNEIGLDPGIDHMSAMKTIHEIRK
jgi:saccharopine dehydrogenase-like NADP-dependent oxidoreductase